nr:glucosaminidase domain-containing protein [Listeria ilorinensis]
MLISLGIIAAFIREAYLIATAPAPAYKSKEEDFINQLSKHAQEIQQEEGILTSITLAQAILESNWGESDLAQEANNLFGVKASGDVPKVNMKTKEYVDGKWIEIQADFRKYDDWNASLDDHAQLFLRGTSWDKDKYKPVIEASGYEEAALALVTAGYATDPDYAYKLIDLIEQYDLAVYDKIDEKLLSTRKISAYGEVKEGADETVWSEPYGLVGAQKVEKISYFARDDLQLIGEAKTTDATWYQFAVDGKTIGWVKSDQIVPQ